MTLTASNVFFGFWDPFTSLSSNNVINFGLVDNVPRGSARHRARLHLATLSPRRCRSSRCRLHGQRDRPAFAVVSWQLNGNSLTGETNSTLSITNISATNTGYYSVLATNLAGSIASTNALLALVPPSAAQFQSISVQTDGSVQISFTGDAVWNYTVKPRPTSRTGVC
ncbi:MAG: hypothetical protein WDN00_17395 [Limisphaerales bacterium]